MTTDQAAQTHLSPTLRAMSAPPGPLVIDDDLGLPPEWQALMWNGLVAFATDPGYLTDIVLAANEIDRRTELNRQSAAHRRLRQQLGRKVEQDGECWAWTATTTSKGVPLMRNPDTGKAVAARAFTVEQWHGPDDTRWMIQAGECGNRLCVNPCHATWRHVERRR